jgi:hypothetical protein
MSRVLRIAAMLAAVMAIAAMPATAGSTPKLHPSGFGEHSYAAWKAHEGLQDSRGSKDQALYLQKMTATTTFAAGVAVFNHVEGLPVSEVWPLEFWWREDGWCGAGAPRFNLRVETAPGTTQLLFFGCNSGMVQLEPPRTDDDGRTWNHRQTVGPAPMGTVVSLAIVFDEGNDVGEGFAYLDDIRVGDWLWTSASDNGGGNTPVDSETLELMWGAPLETLLMP